MRQILILAAILTAGMLPAAELSLEEANRLADAAIEKAQELDMAIAVAVVDQHGNLKAFQRMDGAMLVAAESARMKAYTSASLPWTTAQVAEFSSNDPNNALLSMPGFLLMQGGVPILSDGEHIGGIGVGGGSGPQDEECALAGMSDD